MHFICIYKYIKTIVINASVSAYIPIINKWPVVKHSSKCKCYASIYTVYANKVVHGIKFPRPNSGISLPAQSNTCTLIYSINVKHPGGSSSKWGKEILKYNYKIK